MLGLPQSLIDDGNGGDISEGDSAVVTLTWVRGALLLVVLLTHRQGAVAAVLDPSDQDVTDALVQWGQFGRLPLKPQLQCKVDAHVVGRAVHLDALVTSLMASRELDQGEDQFRWAANLRTDVELALCRLAGVHRIRWAVARPVRIFPGLS